MLRLLPSRTLRAAAQTRPDWSKTVNLPRSSFPARPSASQLETYRKQCADDLYDWQLANRPQIRNKGHYEKFGDNGFVLHDGPPYANGAVHAGHALNKILKDIIVRSQLGIGKRVQYQPGWDCHGLPIELKALQQRQKSAKKSADGAASGQLSAGEIRATAAELASKTVEEQREEFKSWGVMGEWYKPYKTMDRDFEIRQLGVFREMVKKGLIFRDHRPVYWSPSSRTALAEAELEYDDKHKCTAAFVKMPFVQLPEVLSNNSAISKQDISALTWTTTPWTLPANKAIAVGKDIEYSVVELHQPIFQAQIQDQLLVAKNRVGHVLSFLPEGTKVKCIVDSIMGSELVDNDASTLNVFQNQVSRLVTADFVTTTMGTGLVHMAPGHGMDDYTVCQKYGIGPAFAPVDGAGKFTREAFPANVSLLENLFAEKQGAEIVLSMITSPKDYFSEGPAAEALQGSPLLLASHSFTHKNPIDWRTKKPVIVRATAQWFADVSLIKDRALQAIEDVRFVPESGKNRLKAFIEGRSQWCISRQRAWGVPIPALYHKTTGEVCISDESIAHIISTIDTRGTDAWFSDAEDELAWVSPSLEAGMWIRGKDTMDVWFDSGTTWTSLSPRAEDKPLAEVCVEGSDQHRGWFQSSLLTAIATQDPAEKPKAPYGALLTHGFILDGEGKKMSKSLGNVISPAEIISGSLLQPKAPRKSNKIKAGKNGQVPVADPVAKSTKKKQDSLGPDLLRLWVASSDYTKDVPISQQGLFSVQQALQKYRITLRFFCGLLSDISANHGLPRDYELSFADKFILNTLAERSSLVREAYQAFAFHDGVKRINEFINSDLSAFYFEVIKDILYAGLAADRARVQFVLVVILTELMHWLSPLVPHLVAETHAHLPEALRTGAHDPLKKTWTAPYTFPTTYPNDHYKSYSALRAVSQATRAAQEKARAAGKLGSGLACRVELHIRTPTYNLESDFASSQALIPNEELASLLVVSRVDVIYTQSRTLEAVSNLDAEEWRSEEVLPHSEHVEEGVVPGKVVVLPPDMSKCVRCWQYTAESEEEPCLRCRKAVAEREAAV